MNKILIWLIQHFSQAVVESKRRWSVVKNILTMSLYLISMYNISVHEPWSECHIQFWCQMITNLCVHLPVIFISIIIMYWIIAKKCKISYVSTETVTFQWTVSMRHIFFYFLSILPHRSHHVTECVMCAIRKWVIC